MRIGVIGSGNVGSGLAGFWERAGHEVRVSTRDTVGETAAFGEVVVLAVPNSACEEVLSAAGPLEGKCWSTPRTRAAAHPLQRTSRGWRREPGS
jgi:predicted dinucleotide-binding enzyme